MARIYRSVAELVGHTPLLELTRLEKEYNLQAKLLAKLESFNPAGSVKDRIAHNIICDAENSGRLKPGGTIIEATSGNTGIGLAAAAAMKGYRLIIAMPDSMSLERRRLIAAYGATIVLTPGHMGMRGAIARANELASEIPGSIIAGQFANRANPEAHKTHTGPEIWEDTDGKIDIFVAGAGTGGTLTGVGEFLKSKNPDIMITAIEPAASAVLSGKKAGRHGLQGLGPGFVPDIMNTSIIDHILPVEDTDAKKAARLLAKTEGILCGISGGAALWGAMELAKLKKNINKTLVLILPDSGERYLSTDLYEMPEPAHDNASHAQ